MASSYTTNYNLDKYVGTDKPNLRDQYNAAMDKIDAALLSANTNATEAKATTQSFQGDIDAVSTAVSNETTARQNADTALAGDIADNTTAIANNATAITNEATARQNADTGLAGDIATNTTAISNEASARQSADDALQLQINAITSTKYLLALGDSFGVDAVTAPNFWHTYVGQALNLTVKNYCEGYDGFYARNPTTNNNFLSRAQQAAADNTFSNDDVEYVILHGGLNDIGESESNIRNAISGLCTYLVNTFTNARIIFAGPTTWHAFYRYDSQYDIWGTYHRAMRYFMSDACAKSGQVTYIDTLFNTVGDSTCYAGTTWGDHYSENGSKVAATAILNGIYGGQQRVRSINFGTDALLKNSNGDTVGHCTDAVVKIKNGLPTYVIKLTGGAITASWSGDLFVHTPILDVIQGTTFMFPPMFTSQQDMSSGFPPAMSIGKADIGALCKIGFIKPANATNSDWYVGTFTDIGY